MNEPYKIDETTKVLDSIRVDGPTLKLIKVEARVWDALRTLKREDDTFNDVILGLLNKRTEERGDKKLQVIQYQRRLGFFTQLYDKKEVGFEIEYNDIKGQRSSFVLDLEIRKIFFGKKILSPSEFFGTDDAHKHYSPIHLKAYLYGIVLTFWKELRINFRYGNEATPYDDITRWRKIYYEYNLSYDSFIADIEEPLRLSEDDTPSLEWKSRIEAAIASKLLSSTTKEK